MLKWWHSALDPKTKNIHFKHIWVLLLGIPLEMWNREAFAVIGNYLSLFLHVVNDVILGMDKRVDHLLVEIDIS